MAGGFGLSVSLGGALVDINCLELLGAAFGSLGTAPPPVQLVSWYTLVGASPTGERLWGREWSVLRGPEVTPRFLPPS